MSLDPEPSIHDYARFHGLVQDYTSHDPLEQISPLHEDTYRAILDGPSDSCNHEPTFCLKDTSGAIQSEESSRCCTSCLAGAASAFQVGIHAERMVIDASSASLLASILQLSSASPCVSDDHYFDVRPYRWLKCELPLLRSDPECDLQDFIQPLEPDLKNEFLPFESLDEDADEGLSWPSKYDELPNEVWKKILLEKPTVTAEILRYISEISDHISQKTQGTDLEMLGEHDLVINKEAWPKSCTPPLLPMSPETIPFIPSSTAGDLDLLSDQPSITSDELRRVELRIFAKDSIKALAKSPGLSPQSSDPMLLDSDGLIELYSPLKCLVELPSSPPERRIRLQDLKVEVPLFEMGSDGESPWKRKSVSFSDSLTKIIPDFPEPLPNSESDTVLEEIESFFSEAIGPIAGAAERKVESEQLQEADTLRRMAVPKLDFSVPIAPWKIDVLRSEPDNANGTQNEILLGMRSCPLRDYIWPLRHQVEHELQWAPFATALGKFELQETIPEDESIAGFVEQPVLPYMHITPCKSQGLRLLDEIKKSAGDELEEGPSCEEQSLFQLIRKRRLDLQADEDRSSASKSRLCRAFHPLGSLTGISPSIRASVDALMHMGTENACEPSNSEVTCVTSKAATPSQGESQGRLDEPRTIFRSSPILPGNMATQDCRMFIVSANLLKNRKLVRQIQESYAAAELIERDSLHSSSETPVTMPRTDSWKASTASSEYEADIIPSPDTGLVLTTLQKVKQRSLPGQASQSAIRDRIKCVAPMYERLIVIIDEDSWPGEYDQNVLGHRLDSSDSEAIRQFEAFCSSLQDSTQVIFSSGGVEQLSKRIVALMIKYSEPYPNIQLTQDETSLEVFLRKAGMNAYAAQMILVDLSRANMDRTGGSDFELMAFVKMSDRERFARFESLLGGRKALSRIHQTFAAHW